MHNLNISLSKVPGRGGSSIGVLIIQVMRFTVPVMMWLAAMSLMTSIAYAQNASDLDLDGVPDVIDHDQDNDGISNALEGMVYLQRLSDSPAQYYDVNQMDDVSYQGSSYVYTLSNVDTGTQLRLHGRLISSDTSIDWTMHESLPKVRNLGAGSSLIEWNFGSDHSLHNIDMTISDLDGSRSETIVVSAASIVGYSLAVNSNIVVTKNNGLITFVGTGAGGESMADAVTLHFRQSNGLQVSYESAADHRIAGADSEIAGFRHSFVRQHYSSRGLSYYQPLAQFRDTDGDGVADHRDLDSDNDGLGDVVEVGGSDQDSNNMADGLVDRHGVPHSTNRGLTPAAVAPAYSASLTVSGDDADRDGLLSSVDNLPDQFGGSRSGVDTDRDGVQDLDEIRIHHTDPDKADTDNDGLTDYSELQRFLTNPLSSDTDSDGISDSDELMVYATDPTSVDSDLDGITDGAEIQAGTDPLAALIDTSVSTEETRDSTLDGFTERTAEPDSASLLLQDPERPDDQSPGSVSLRTGLSGAPGCSVSSVRDPFLPLMFVIASLYLFLRKKNV